MEGLFATVLSLFLVAQERSPDSLQALELQQDATKLFILGEGSTQNSGLYTEVRRCLETTFRQWKTKTLKQDWDLKLKNCLAVDLRVSDLNFEFQRQRANNPALMDLIYQKTLSLLPEDKKTYSHLRRRNLLEIKYREYLVRFPIFADALLFPGWSADDSLAIEDLVLPNNSMPRELFERALQSHELSIAEFTLAFSTLHPDATEADLQLAQARYLFFGRALLNQWSEAEWSADLENLPDLASGTRKWVETWKNDLPFYSQLLKIEKESQSIDWDSPYFASEEKLNTLFWVDAQFRRLWPRFQTQFPLKEIADEARQLHQDPRLPLLGLEIEKFVLESGNWTPEQGRQFRKAKAEIESGSWLYLPDSQSSYRILPDDLRNLLAASIFPQLSLRAARAILEDQFFKLPPVEQMAALKLADQKFSEQLSESDLLKLEDRRGLLRELVKLHTDWLLAKDLPWIEWQADHVLLANGKDLVKRSEVERDEMRAAIEDFGSQINYGWYPKFLMDALMIHIFPSQNYWSHEGDKLFSELTRQNQLWNLRQGLQKLKAEGADSQAIEKMEAQLKSLFVSDKGVSRIDGSSPGVWLASFWSGFKHDPARAIPGVLTGAAITLVFKWSGLRWALVFVVGDSVLRFQTAAAQNPRNLEWYEINLDKGTSTFVGKSFGKMAQDLYQTGNMLWDPKEDFDHLEAWYRTGEMAYDFLAFSSGSAAMNRLLSETSLSLRRTQSQRWDSLQEAKSLSQKLTEKEDLLRQKIRSLESQRAQLVNLDGKLSAKLEIEIQRVTEELTRINSTTGMKRLSLPAFWARQTGRLLWRTGETLFLARPLPKPRDFQAQNLIRYWQRDFQMTRIQVEDLLLKADKNWRASLKSPALEARWVDRKSLSKQERTAIAENPAENLSAILRALEKYERALPATKNIGKDLDNLLEILKKTLEQEELAVSGIKKFKTRSPGVLEAWLARVENYTKGEFRGARTEMGVHNELQFSNRALDQATTLRLLDASRAIDQLLALEARLRLRFNAAEFAASSAQISALKTFGERLMELQKSMNAELSRRSAFVSVDVAASSWTDAVTSLQKNQWLSPQTVFEKTSLQNALAQAKVITELPPALRNIPGEWKVNLEAKPFEAFFLKSPAGNIELYIGREIFGEWRLLSRFQL